MAQSQTVYHDGTKSTYYPNGAIKKGGHRNWRNNNPGNIKAGNFTNSHGAIGDDGTFAVFNSMDDGYKAQADLLQSGNYKNLSLDKAIHRWAPASDGNDSAGYVNYVSGKTGIDPNKKMSDMSDEEMGKIVRAMSAREGMKSGDVIEGATVDANGKATGGKKVDDPFASGGSGGGSGNGTGTGNGSDPCAFYNNTPGGTLESPSNLSDAFAQIEGNGSYTQGANKAYNKAAGRYQFVASTAEEQLVKTGLASNKSEASALWHECRASDSAKCRGVQDKIANNYIQELGSGLSGEDRTIENLYMKYNQGSGGARAIRNAEANGTRVTNSQIVSNMDNQAWPASNGDPTKFKQGLRGYIKRKGIDPDTKF